MSIVLLVQEIEVTYKVILGKKPTFLGRSSKCHLKIADPLVSGKHCALFINDDGRAVVKDLESSNGTFVNGFKIEESLLMMDDEISIGGVKLWLDASEMTPKEKRLHVRETAKTRMKFIKMEEEKASSPGHSKNRIRNNEKSSEEGLAEKQASNDFDPKTSIIKVDLEDIEKATENVTAEASEASEEEDFTRTRKATLMPKKEVPHQPQEIEEEARAGDDPAPSEQTKNRLAEKAKGMKTSTNINDPGQAVAGEAQFDQGKSSGQTQFIKIEKGKLKKTKLGGKKPVKKKKDESEENKNFLGKLKGFFKK